MTETAESLLAQALDMWDDCTREPKARAYVSGEFCDLMNDIRRLLAKPQQPAEGLKVEVHPETALLVERFSRALLEKLAAAEKKYGYTNGWTDPYWMDECRRKLVAHVVKGDPRDVAAYCAFLWDHGANCNSEDAKELRALYERIDIQRGTIQQINERLAAAEQRAQAVEEMHKAAHDDAIELRDRAEQAESARDAALKLLTEVNDVLCDAWRDRRIPHDVISADLARRLVKATQ